MSPGSLGPQHPHHEGTVVAGVSAVRGLSWLESDLMFLFLPTVAWEFSFFEYIGVWVVRAKGKCLLDKNVFLPSSAHPLHVTPVL